MHFPGQPSGAVSTAIGATPDKVRTRDFFKIFSSAGFAAIFRDFKSRKYAAINSEFFASFPEFPHARTFNSRKLFSVAHFSAIARKMISSKFMKNFYNSIAKKWDATRQNSWGEFEFARDFLSAKKLLDAGCGNGRLNFWLAKNNFRGEYFGVDASAKLIEIARKNFPGKKFAVENLLEFEKANSADAIFCVAVLHHFSDSAEREKVVRNLHSALRPGGKIFATVWNLWQPRFWHYFFRQKSRELEIPFAGKSSRRVHAFTKSELRKIFARAGFKNIKIFPARHSAKSNFLRARNLIILAEK